MSNALKYKDYTAVIEFDTEEMMLFGTIIGINDKIIFYADDSSQIEEEFHSALDDYLDYCARHNREAQKPYSGNISLRISPELHKKVEIKAASEGIKNNALITKAIEKYTEDSPKESCCYSPICDKIRNAFIDNQTLKIRETFTKRNNPWSTLTSSYSTPGYDFRTQ